VPKKIAENLFAVLAPPRTQLGEPIALPRPPIAGT